jgi:hypothetical protein
MRLLILSPIFSILFLLMGCASQPVNNQGLVVISQSEYQKRIEPFTQKIETYQGLLNTLHLTATLLNTEVVNNQLLNQARMYQWSPEQLETEKVKSQDSLSKQIQVFVSLYTPEKKHDDLHKNKTLWKIFLDSQGRRFEGKAAKVKLLTNEIQSLYPDHTRFGTPYLITFPVPANEVETGKVKFTLTGSVDSVSIEF